MLLIFFISSLITAVVAYFVKHKVVSHAAVLIHLVMVSLLTLYEFNRVGVLQLTYFRPDHLCLIFMTLLSLIGLMSSIHYIGYSNNRSPDLFSLLQHNVSMIIFNTSIVGVLMANHFGVLWVFVEITTISTAFLIQHDRSKQSMEATWKYLFISSMALALAFTGILFLGIAAKEAESINFSFDAIKALDGKLSNNWIGACFLFILTGFSIKLGLVPMFNVDIDAKDASPSPVGAMLASVLVNAGFVSVFRFYNAFSTSNLLPWMNQLLIIVGILSLIFSAVYMLRVRNVKRLMAYSSMEHVALVVIAFASGGIGYFAAVFHLILHSLIKSTFFFQISQLEYIYDGKNADDLRGYLKINPAGAVVVISCLFSLMAFPPSGMFVSEFMMFQAMYEGGRWWLIVLSLSLMLFIIYGLLSRFLPIVFGKLHLAPAHDRSANHFETVMQLAIILVVFYIGFIKPPFIVSIINQSIANLP